MRPLSYTASPASPPCHRPLRRPVRAFFLAAILLLPVATTSAQTEGWGSEVERELAVERTCEDWQKVRRCADAEGQLQYECVAKSPLARFLAFFRSDGPKDDEVRVIRHAPEPRTTVVAENGGTSENRSDDEAPAQEDDDEAAGDEEDDASPSTSSSSEGGAEEADGQYRKVRVNKVEKDLPRCRESR